MKDLLRDLGGNEVELYMDTDESVWKNNPAVVIEPIKPAHVLSKKEACSWRSHALQPSSPKC